MALMTAAPSINQSPKLGAANPLFETSSKTPTIAVTAVTKNGVGSQFLEAIDSKIGVRTMHKLMIKPALVAEVRDTPDVSKKRMSAWTEPKPMPSKASGRVIGVRFIVQIANTAIEVMENRIASRANTEVCSVSTLAAR